MKKFIIAEPTDYVSYPGGGQIQQAKNLMKAYGNEIVLVGFITDNSCKVGEWTRRIINNIEYDYFAVKKIDIIHKKTLVPQRITALFWFWWYRKKIVRSKTKNIFLQAPEIVYALSGQKWDSFCYRFPGTLNPLNSPRYKFGKYIKFVFEKPFFKRLKKADCIIASADDHQIQNLKERSDGILNHKNIIKYPTRYDDHLYRPLNIKESRNKLELKKEDKIFLQIGRLSKNKGCLFILEGFKEYSLKTQNAKLLYLGDGEERDTLQKYIDKHSLGEKVILLGHKPKEQLVNYICSADAIVFGSYCKRWKEPWDEGWSVAMVESLACGKPIITTPVSGSFDMVKDAKNGYILKKRQRNELAKLFEKVLQLDNPNKISIQISSPWKMSLLKNDFEKAWPMINN